MKKLLCCVFLLSAMFVTVAMPDCGLNSDDVITIFDTYAWLPEYPEGTSSRHPRSNKFCHAFISNTPGASSYPAHLDIFPNLNDTIEVFVRLVNADDQPWKVSDVNLESWVQARVFEIGDNVLSATALATAPSVKWRVRYWHLPNSQHERPDTLWTRQDYLMVLDVWNVPEGKYQLGILGTDSVPSWFDVMPSSDFYHLLPAQDLADSINAWATIAERVMADGTPGAAAAWLDSIFTHNNKSLVGYYQQAKYFWAKEDSANTVASFDSVLQRIKNWDDPALPDTTSPLYDNISLKWKHFMYDVATREREIYINCPELR